MATQLIRYYIPLRASGTQLDSKLQLHFGAKGQWML